MRHTIDAHTGKRFYWNETASVEGTVVPAKETKDDFTWLHPDRVPAGLLAELNPSQEAADGR